MKHIAKVSLSLLTLLLPLLAFSQLDASYTIADDDSEIKTAVIAIEATGGQAPYKYFWSEKSISTTTSKIENGVEGKEYTVKVQDATGKEKTLVIDVPAASIPEKMSAFFAPIVGFMDTYFFFDPFHAIGLYDNRVMDDNGNPVLNPNGTIKTIKLPFMVIWLIAGAIFFTLRFGFINFRGIGHSLKLVRGKYDEPDAKGEVTHFQALATAVSGTVGLGK